MNLYHATAYVRRFGEQRRFYPVEFTVPTEGDGIAAVLAAWQDAYGFLWDLNFIAGVRLATQTEPGDQ